MQVDRLVDILGYCEPAACVATIILMARTRHLRPFRSFALFLGMRALSNLSGLLILWLAHETKSHSWYRVYFYSYWTSYAVEAMLGLAMVYDVYKLAMAPLPGLQKLGMLMFRWAAGIACAVAFGMALGPHTTSVSFVMKVVTQLQQTQAILTLCLLLFVCLAIRPMGLSHRSKIFGVSLGLGVLAASDLALSSWIAQAKNMYSILSLATAVGFFLSLAIWTFYFVVPEPKRRMIVLPTTSPFLRWNQISMVLGDEPGFVAVGGVAPELFAPAEVEIMRRASAKMVDGSPRPEPAARLEKFPRPGALSSGKPLPDPQNTAIPKMKFISM